MNGKKPLTLDFKTFCTSTGLDYNNGKYVAHPSPEAVKAELTKIVLGGNYSSTNQINSIQQMIAYCLMNRIKVDTRKIIYSDLVTKLTSKSRLKYVSFSRFISCALEVLVGTQYTQDENFGSLFGILKRFIVSISFLWKEKESEVSDCDSYSTQVIGPKASGVLYKKRNKSKPKNTTLETQATPPNVLTKDYEKTHSVSPKQTAHPQDTEENIYSLLRDSILHLMRALIAQILCPKPIDKGLPSTVPGEGIGKTKPLSEGPHGDNDLEGFKPPADMEPSTTPITDPQTLLLDKRSQSLIHQFLLPEMIQDKRSQSLIHQFLVPEMIQVVLVWNCGRQSLINGLNVSPESVGSVVLPLGKSCDVQLPSSSEVEGNPIPPGCNYEGNVDHKDQTNKLVNETMKINDNIRKARIDKRAKLLKALQVSKTLEADSTLKEEMKKMAKSNNNTSNNLSSLTELLNNAKLPKILTKMDVFQSTLNTLSTQCASISESLK
nr:hypothetical protein [Tanacetum cinerariifolium]